MSAPLSVVVLADTDAASVQTSLVALSEALEAVEATGRQLDTTIVDATDDPAARLVLDGVEGARLLPAGAGGRAAAWSEAGAAVEGELVWLGGTDAAPAPGAVQALVDALEAAPDAAAAVSAPEPGPYAAVRREALRQAAARLGELPADAPAGALVGTLAEAGAIVRVPGAGCRLERRVQPTATAAMPAGTIQVFQPDAIEVGVFTYSGPNSVIKTWRPYERIRIGAYCSIADDVYIAHTGDRGLFDSEGRRVAQRLRGGHYPDLASTFPIALLVADAPHPDPPPDGSVLSRPMEIGADVWIGSRSTVLDVGVGHGAVVAAGSVVFREVPPYAIVSGNPAKVLRMRFSQPVIDRLVRIAWWDWDVELVRASWRWFLRPVAEFVTHFDPAGEVPEG